MRTASMPAATSRSTRLSTARFDGAEASTFSSRAAARRIVEGDREPRPLPARDDPGRRIVGGFALRQHAHDRADPDLRPAQLAPARPRIGDQRAPGEPALLDRLDVGEQDPPRLPLAQGKPLAIRREALHFRRPLDVEQRTESPEVLFEIHAVPY